MKALLLAAGFGTRLRPLTETIPKCLVPINGQPLLDIWLEQLLDAGIGPFLINTHYLPDQVEGYVKKSRYKEMITLAYEPDLLGTAGTVRGAADFFGNEDGLLIHADNYCLANFKAFLHVHASKPPDILLTMMTFRTQNPKLCGIVEVNKEKRVIDFYEKVDNPPSDLANGAVYILPNELIKFIVNSNYSDFSTEVIPGLLGKIITFENESIHIDIGTISEYKRANGIKEKKV